MSGAWGRFVVKYLLAAALGSALVVLGASVMKALAAQQDATQARLLLDSRRPQDAVARLLLAKCSLPEQRGPAQGSSELSTKPDSADEVRSGSSPGTPVGSLKQKLKAAEARLVNEINRLERELASDPRSRNPYAAEYRDALAAYMEFEKEAEKIRKKRDAATGDAHLRYEDQLRRLKAEDIRLGHEFSSAKQKYMAWNREHPNGSRIDRLKSELSEVRARLKETDRGSPRPE